jgi:hypothetical protein
LDLFTDTRLITDLILVDLQIERWNTTTVQFEDGLYEAHIKNKIAASHNDSVNGDGHSWYTFDNIIGHETCNEVVGCIKTTTWWLEVLWDGDQITWERLAGMKSKDLSTVAQYAYDSQLSNQPEFGKWVNYDIKKKHCLIKQAMKRKRFNRYKYVVEIPRTMAEAIALDKNNGNTLWQDAVRKEMTNILVAFKVHPESQPIPSGYKVIGVQLGFHIAELNGMQLLKADIGNAYLNADPCELYWTRPVPKSGPDLEGRIMLIMHALYSMKSAGSAWNHHFARELLNMGFAPFPANPDV